MTEPSAFEAVHEAVKKAGITPESASVAMIPQNYIKLEASQANTMIRLMEALEEHDDVQNVHSNFDIDQKLLEEVAGYAAKPQTSDSRKPRAQRRGFSRYPPAWPPPVAAPNPRTQDSMALRKNKRSLPPLATVLCAPHL